MERGDAVARFAYQIPSLDSYWRAIVLFGQNVASYKFALAGALLDVDPGTEVVSLYQLALPFASRVADHLRAHDKQGTFDQSRFLDACRAFNKGELDADGLRAKTVQLGFANVIDAFHIVDKEEVPELSTAGEKLTKAGSNDLAPEVSERARMRQRRVQAWVRSVLEALGAELLHDTGDGDGAFLTAQFDDEFEPELGGRTLMHLAFDRYGLEHHPDAELCAVGSPVFDELLGLLRMRGDMHATVPVVPEDIGPSPYSHAASLRLVHRRLVPSGSWSGQATFRATIGEAETSEHLITADINGHNHQRLPRRPLQDGESLPAVFDTPSKVIADFERAASSQLESLRRSRAEQVGTEQARELDRIRSGYQAQIEEAPYDDKQRLRRALSSEEHRLSRSPDIRARAKLLALTLDEDDWVVEETWSGPSDTEGTLTYEWGMPEPAVVESDVSGEPIRVLAMCSSSHWVDESETAHCLSCDGVRCAACGDEAVFADCPLCGVSSCAVCRTDTGGLCLRCASPERAPELDDEFAIAWRLNAGATLRVGERVSELTRTGGQSPSVVVRDEDANSRDRGRLRSYAREHNLPLDCGLVLRDLTRHPGSQDPSRVLLDSSATVEVELSTNDHSSAVDPAAVSDVPEHADIRVVAEQDFLLGPLLQKLRSEVRPPTPPAVVVTRRSSFTDIYLEGDRLVEERSVVGDDGALSVSEVRTAPLQWRSPALDDAMLADAELGNLRVSLQRRNDAILVTAHSGGRDDADAQWMACPEGRSAADQIGCFNLLLPIGTPGGRLGKRANEAAAIDRPFPVSTECELVNRTIKPVAELVALDSDFGVIPVDAASLSSFGARPDVAAAEQVAALPAALNTALLEQTKRSFTSALRNGFEVAETWRGHGTATHTYRTFNGEPLSPALDDLGIREANFGVCRDGHFYSAGTAALCASCQSWACGACDELDHQASITCPGCSEAVCRRCVSAAHVVSGLECVLCKDHACSDCGRDPHVASCPMCDRTVCSSCRVDDHCPACSRLAPATTEELGDLPGELCAAGANVWIGADDDAMVVLVNRGGAFERAIVRDGSIADWIAFGRNEIDSHYRLRLAASRSFDRQVTPIVERLEPDVSLSQPHLFLQSERSFHPTWSVAETRASGKSTQSFALPDGDLASLAAADFPAVTQVPEAAGTIPPELTRVFASMDEPATVNLALRWERLGHDLAITPDGITDTTIEAKAFYESVSGWAATDTTPAWVVDDWEPVPAVRAYATARGEEVVIVGMASFLALGIRTAEQAAWYIITGSEKAAPATALSRWMGLGDADEVRVFTDPRKIQLSAVTNATNISLRVTPLGAITNGPRAREDATAEALAAWAPAANVVTPELQVLPRDLRLALEQEMRPSAPWAWLEIGAHVEQLVTVESGQEWRYDARLAAGQTDARRIDNSTRHVLDTGVIDREGHFGVDHAPCNYCGGRTCAVCVDGMVSCDCCDAKICKRCVLEPHSGLWLCPACASTRPPTRSEAREQGRLLSTRRMLIGTDPRHTVVVEQSKNRWTRKDADGEKHLIASPSVAEYLDERLAGGPPT